MSSPTVNFGLVVSTLMASYPEATEGTGSKERAAIRRSPSIEVGTPALRNSPPVLRFVTAPGT